jgi:hypothetical protein
MAGFAVHQSCVCFFRTFAASQVENVECVPPNHIKFDFLGKDSIRYENTVDVEVAVYKAVEHFIKVDAKGKRECHPGQQLRVQAVSCMRSCL